jgi:quinol-cytochrome oxidoreductase complex cytochrome b subunit
LPFILVLCVIIHLLFLHEFGSNNPLGIPSFLDNAPFSVYYTLKDGFSVILILIIFVYIFTLNPDLLGHSVNYEKANFLVTPAHIVPE